jgi:hypothetical protein
MLILTCMVLFVYYNSIVHSATDWSSYVNLILSRMQQNSYGDGLNISFTHYVQNDILAQPASS